MAARDSRNRRIPGLYTRNGRFYGLLWADRGDGRKTARRFSLVDENTKQAVANLTEAKEALDKLRGDRRENTLPQGGRKPGFDAYADEYLALASTQQKRKATRSKETDALARWKAHLATVKVDRITTPMIKAFVEKRLRGCQLAGKAYEPASPRTVSLDLIALRNVLKAAAETGHLRELPRFPKIKAPEPARRPLLTPNEFDSLLLSCLARKEDGDPLTKNGEQLRDFLKFLAYSGAREQEALRVRWSHVDLEARRVFIGADESFTAASMTIGTGGTSKNRGSRVLDFNSQLESLLRDMKERRAPDSSWLFPSPQRGAKDVPAKTLRESFELVRENAKLPRAGFHDLRHLFCSFCVMAGVDFLTIAAWLGHKDGGILIGKVYGHLLDEHRQKMAAKVTIGIAAVPRAD
jgi:integrase